MSKHRVRKPKNFEEKMKPIRGRNLPLLPMTRKWKTHKFRTAAVARISLSLSCSHNNLRAVKQKQKCSCLCSGSICLTVFVWFVVAVFWCVITNYKRFKNLSLPVCFFFSSFVKQKQKITIFFCEVKLFILTKLCFIIFRAVSQMETIIGKGG